MLLRRLLFSALGVVVLLAAGVAHAAGGACMPVTCAPQAVACAPICPPAPQFVEKTVMVPQYFTEMRTVTVTRCRPEVREQVYTVHRMVSETQVVERPYTVLVPQVRTRTVTYTVHRPVHRTVEQQFTVMVPYTETRTATRRVCRMVPERQTRMVRQCVGRWEERVIEVPAMATYAPMKTCAPMTAAPMTAGPMTAGPMTAGPMTAAPMVHQRVCRVWVPEFVDREIEVTIMRPVVEEIPFEYTVTLCRPEVRTRPVTICEMVPEQQTREVQYTVCVPEQRVATHQVVVCRPVQEQRTRQFTVMVPFTEQQQVPVQVCRMVPKTITVPVAVGCGVHWRHWGCRGRHRGC